MAFQLRLATAPGQLVGVLRISLEGGGIAATVDFGPPGTAISRDFNTSATAPFTMHMFYFVDNDRVSVQISNVNDNDVFSVMAIPGSGQPTTAPILFLGN